MVRKHVDIAVVPTERAIKLQGPFYVSKGSPKQKNNRREWISLLRKESLVVDVLHDPSRGNRFLYKYTYIYSISQNHLLRDQMAPARTCW